MSRSGRHTPLRRISQGSLVGHRHSQAFSGQTGLEFLEQALVDVCDETEQMFVNMEELDRISDGMEGLAHSLAGYLQAMRINAFCVEWPQVGETPVCSNCKRTLT
jgi:DASH complex subunit DAM1